MKNHTPKALETAQKKLRLTAGLTAALMLLSALLLMMEWKLIPAFLPDAFFTEGTVYTAAIGCAVQAGFWYNLARETGREIGASAVRASMVVLLIGDILRVARKGLGIPVMFAPLGTCLLLELLFELCWRHFSRVDAVRDE